MKILIVDDSRLVRGTFKRFVVSLGYDPEFLEADSGDKALAIWESEKPDIIILDLIIPEPEGEEVLRTIRSTDENSFIAVLTSNFQAPVKARVLGNQAQLFIEKPLSETKVRQIMETFFDTR